MTGSIMLVNLAADPVLIWSRYPGSAVRHLHLVCQQPLLQQVGLDLPRALSAVLLLGHVVAGVTQHFALQRCRSVSL